MLLACSVSLQYRDKKTSVRACVCPSVCLSVCVCVCVCVYCLGWQSEEFGAPGRAGGVCVCGCWLCYGGAEMVEEIIFTPPPPTPAPLPSSYMRLIQGCRRRRNTIIFSLSVHPPVLLSFSSSHVDISDCCYSSPPTCRIHCWGKDCWLLMRHVMHTHCE